MSEGKVDLKRSQIKEMLPKDVKFSLRRVDFTDLARSSAYYLNIKRDGEEMPSVFFGKEHRDAWVDVIEARDKIIGNYTYKGGLII